MKLNAPGKFAPVQRLLHVMFSLSAAGTLNQVLYKRGLPRRIACLEDDLSFGPISGDSRARSLWVEKKLAIPNWGAVVSETAPFLTACTPDVTPVAWISYRSARTYAGFLWWLSQLADDWPCKVIDVSNARDLVSDPGAMTEMEIDQRLDTEVMLDIATRRRHRAKWARLVAEDAPFRIIDPRGELISAPMTAFDSILLEEAGSEWRKPAWLIGGALIHNKRLSQTNDFVLFARIVALAKTGALEWRGDLSSMRACEVRLPDRANRQ